MLADLLKTIRSLKSQVQIIHGLDLSEKEKKIIDTALIKLNEDLLNTDSLLSNFLEAINILKNQVEILKELDLLEEEKEILITAIDRLKPVTFKR
jgi:hypothetical protein